MPRLKELPIDNIKPYSMIDFPIDLEVSTDNAEYDPFLHHVIRHKLRKKKNRRKLKRILGIGKRKRRKSQVRKGQSRYSKTVRRPVKKRSIAKPIKRNRPIAMPSVKFGNPIQRESQLKGQVSKIGIISSKGNTSPRASVSRSNSNSTSARIRPKTVGSGDTILPYKRRYGSKKKSVKKIAKEKPQEVMPMIEDQSPLEAPKEDNIVLKMEAMKSDEKEKLAQRSKTKSKMKTIVGVAVLGILVTGFLAYKMKSKIQSNGRTS